MKGMWKKLFSTKRKEKKGSVTNEATDTSERPQSVPDQMQDCLPTTLEQQIIEYQQRPPLLTIPQLPPIELFRTELDDEPTEINEVTKISADPSESVETAEEDKDGKPPDDEGLCFDVASTATDETECQLENLTHTTLLDKHAVHEFVKRKSTQKSCCNIMESEMSKVEDMDQVLDTVDSENEQEKEAEEEIGDNTKEPSDKDDSSSGEETPPRIEETSDMRLVDK